jgi:biotin carboxylase
LEVFHAVFRPGMYRLPAHCVMPSGLGGAAYTAILARARQTGRALPPGTGPVVLEFVLSAQGPVLTGLDVAPGVEPISAILLRHALGLDYFGDALRLAAGEPHRSAATRDMGAAIIWHAPHAGLVEEVSGLDAARAMPGVQVVHVGLQVGDSVGHIIDAQARDHAGYVLATGPTGALALARAAAALESITITTRAARI